MSWLDGSFRPIPSQQQQVPMPSVYSPLASRPRGQQGIGKQQLIDILDEALALIEDEDFSMDSY